MTNKLYKIINTPYQDLSLPNATSASAFYTLNELLSKEANEAAEYRDWETDRKSVV